MCLLAVSRGKPVMSAKKVEENSMSGEIAVIAAVSFARLQVIRLTYTHHTNDRACPRSAGVYRCSTSTSRVSNLKLRMTTALGRRIARSTALRR